MSRHYKKHVAFIRSAWKYLDTIDSMQRLHAKLETLKALNTTVESRDDIHENIEKKLKWLEDYLSDTALEAHTTKNFQILAHKLPLLSKIGEAFALSQTLMLDADIKRPQIDYVLSKLYNFDARPICELLQGKYSFTYRAMGIKVKRVKWLSRTQDMHATSDMTVNVPWIIGYAQKHIHTISIHKSAENEDTFILSDRIPHEVAIAYNFK